MMESSCTSPLCDISGPHSTHTTETRSTGWYNMPARFFKRMPGGGTVYVKKA